MTGSFDHAEIGGLSTKESLLGVCVGCRLKQRLNPIVGLMKTPKCLGGLLI